MDISHVNFQYSSNRSLNLALVLFQHEEKTGFLIFCERQKQETFFSKADTCL